MKIEMELLANRLIYHAVNTTSPDTPYLNDCDARLDEKVDRLVENARFNETPL